MYTIDDADTAASFVAQLGVDFQDDSARRRSNGSDARSCDGSTRSLRGTGAGTRTGRPKRSTNLVKRVKRVAFGMTNRVNYRTRALLYAGRPNWSLLNP